MIRISKKTDYAIFLMGHLARKARSIETLEDVDLVSAHDLASLTSLNRSVVANLLKDLTRASLLTSVRGVHGGYRLARPADDISLAEIIEALEGPFALIECGIEVDGEAPGSCGCTLSSLCTTRRPLQILQDKITELIANLKVTELCGLDTDDQPNPSQSPTPPVVP